LDYNIKVVEDLDEIFINLEKND